MGLITFNYCVTLCPEAIHIFLLSCLVPLFGLREKGYRKDAKNRGSMGSRGFKAPQTSQSNTKHPKSSYCNTLNQPNIVGFSWIFIYYTLCIGQSDQPFDHDIMIPLKANRCNGTIAPQTSRHSNLILLINPLFTHVPRIVTQIYVHLLCDTYVRLLSQS